MRIRKLLVAIAVIIATPLYSQVTIQEPNNNPPWNWCGSDDLSPGTFQASPIFPDEKPWFFGDKIWIPVYIYEVRRALENEFSIDQCREEIQKVNDRLNNLEAFEGFDLEPYIQDVGEGWENLSHHENNKFEFFLPEYRFDGRTDVDGAYMDLQLNYYPEVHSSGDFFDVGLLYPQALFPQNLDYPKINTSPHYLGNYLNIFLARRLEDGEIPVLGVRDRPGLDKTDLLYIEKRVFGSDFKGAMIHELGHMWGLEHPWGYNYSVSKACNLDDGFASTPPQAEPTRVDWGDSEIFDLPQSCPVWTCDDQVNNDIKVNPFNYMDYAMHTGVMFTEEQHVAMKENAFRNYEKSRMTRDYWTKNDAVSVHGAVHEFTDLENNGQLFNTSLTVENAWLPDNVLDEFAYFNNQLYEPANLYEHRLVGYGNHYSAAYGYDPQTQEAPPVDIFLHYDNVELMRYRFTMNVALSKKWTEPFIDVTDANGAFASSNIKVQAYIDFNRNGEFEAFEKISPNFLDPPNAQITSNDEPFPVSFEWEWTLQQRIAFENAMVDYWDNDTYNTPLGLHDLFYLPTRLRIKIENETSPGDHRARNGETEDYAVRIYEDEYNPLFATPEVQPNFYPNPADDKLVITQATEVTRVEIRMSDNAEIVERFGLEKNKNSQAVLDTSNIPAGEYLLFIYRKDGQTLTHRLLIK